MIRLWFVDHQQKCCYEKHSFMAAISIQSEIILYKFGAKGLRRQYFTLAYSSIREYMFMSWCGVNWTRSQCAEIVEVPFIFISVCVQCYVTHTVSSILLPELEICLRVIAHEHVTCPSTTHHLISVHLIHLTGMLSASPARASCHRHTPPPGQRLKDSNRCAARHYPPRWPSKFRICKLIWKLVI